MRGYIAYVIFTALAGVGLYSLLCVGINKYMAFGFSLVLVVWLIYRGVQELSSKLKE